MMVSLIVIEKEAKGKMIKENKSENNFDLCKKNKKGILMVHFGTVKEEVRKKTLDLHKYEYSRPKNFESFRYREAYTSRMIIKRIYKKEEIRKKHPQRSSEAHGPRGIYSYSSPGKSCDKRTRRRTSER